MVQLLWLWMLSAFVNVVMQELLVRGYIHQLLKTNCNLPVAVVVSNALFTLMHGGAFEAGLLPVANVVSMCLFNMTPSVNALLSGGSCKIEGSVVVSVLNVVLTPVFAIAARRITIMRQAAEAETGRTC